MSDADRDGCVVVGCLFPLPSSHDMDALEWERSFFISHSFSEFGRRQHADLVVNTL